MLETLKLRIREVTPSTCNYSSLNVPIFVKDNSHDRDTCFFQQCAEILTLTDIHKSSCKFYSLSLYVFVHFLATAEMKRRSILPVCRALSFSSPSLGVNEDLHALVRLPVRWSSFPKDCRPVFRRRGPAISPAFMFSLVGGPVHFFFCFHYS